MSETRRFPFGGVPVYNPLSLSKEEALAQFIARQAVYESLMSVLREERPSHVLIIGTRGMGKTTLLQRVRFGVQDDGELAARYIVLAFPEEQYNVNRIHHFLLNAVDALADALERLHDDGMLARVEAYAEKIGKLPPEQIEEMVPRFLAEVSAETKTSLLLLVDNADRLFETVAKRDQWKLRELLANRADITLLGATTQASEGIYESDRAFFEFFKVYNLTPLAFTEVRDLLLRLSESVEGNEGERGAAKRRVEDWLAADAARLRTLVQLTGGNPRTTVLLFHLVLDGLDGGAREYLEQLLDQCTPNYKGRVDELPPQAQQVLDAVALKWDPVTAMEVAEATGLETNAVSTQLTRLVRQGLLERADPGDSKKALYQVAERFFNIWYLMRASRRVRAKLRWFVEFLRAFFDSGELEQMAWERLQLFRGARRKGSSEIESAFAYVLASGADPGRIEDYLRRECAELEPEWRPFIDLIHPSIVNLKREGRGEAKNTQIDESVEELRRATDIDPASSENWRKLGRVLARSTDSVVEAEAALRRAIELDPQSDVAWNSLGSLLAKRRDQRGEAESVLRKAIELVSNARNWDALGDFLAGTPGRRVEAEAAYRKAIELEPSSAMAWGDLGHLLLSQPQRREEAEGAFRRAIDLSPEAARYWLGLAGVLSTVPQRGGEAEGVLRKVIELIPESPGPWTALGALLERSTDRRAEAEAAYRKAIELDQTSSVAWSSLGDFLGSVRERSAEAEAALRKAIELKPESDRHWINLGSFLSLDPDRHDEAELAFRKAIELNSENSWSWALLGKLLAENSKRRDEAEVVLRRATECDPNSFAHWANLGNCLARLPDRFPEAERAIRKAIDIDPASASVWDFLGDLLGRVPERRAEAEAAYRRAIELQPDGCRYWADLGLLLENVPTRSDEAEAAYRKAIELHPDSSMHWTLLSLFLESRPDRLNEAKSAYQEALRLGPTEGFRWALFGVFLACKLRQPDEAEVAMRKAAELAPTVDTLSNLGVLLFCEMHQESEAVSLLRRASGMSPDDHVCAAILAACMGTSDSRSEARAIVVDGSRDASFWEQLLARCDIYAPFGRILLGISESIQKQDTSNQFAPLHRAAALAQLGDFPRASVAFDDALTGDPIEQLSMGRGAIETFLAAAVRAGRVRDCLELLDRKEWKDAWRPIYEALRAVEEGSPEYLKHIAVEIRQPAETILQRIAPRLAAT